MEGGTLTTFATTAKSPKQEELGPNLVLTSRAWF